MRGQGKNKLRTYRLFKHEYKTEEYAKCIMSRGNRSALAKFRCGVAPLRIETGRYERTRLEVGDRVCTMCQLKVEDEFHVLIECPLYCDIHQEMFIHAESLDANYCRKTDEDKFISLLSDPNMVYIVARTLHSILSRRSFFMTC